MEKQVLVYLAGIFLSPFGAVQTKGSRDPFHYGANSLNFHLKLPVTHLSTQPVEHLPGTLNDLFVCTLCQWIW